MTFTLNPEVEAVLATASAQNGPPPRVLPEGRPHGDRTAYLV